MRIDEFALGNQVTKLAHLLTHSYSWMHISMCNVNQNGKTLIQHNTRCYTNNYIIVLLPHWLLPPLPTFLFYRSCRCLSFCFQFIPSKRRFCQKILFTSCWQWNANAWERIANKESFAIDTFSRNVTAQTRKADENDFQPVQHHRSFNSRRLDDTERIQCC